MTMTLTNVKTERMTVDEYRKYLGVDVSRPDKNRKIMNATKIERGGITFDSLLESTAHELFTSHGLQFEFKPKFVVVPGFRYMGKKIIDITWSPDFAFPELRIVLDTKGFPSETFPIKLKLFKKMMFDRGEDWAVWVVKNKSDISTAIYLLKKRIEGQADNESEKFFLQ